MWSGGGARSLCAWGGSREMGHGTGEAWAFASAHITHTRLDGRRRSGTVCAQCCALYRGGGGSGTLEESRWTTHPHALNLVGGWVTVGSRTRNGAHTCGQHTCVLRGSGTVRAAWIEISRADGTQRCGNLEEWVSKLCSLCGVGFACLCCLHCLC